MLLNDDNAIRYGGYASVRHVEPTLDVVEPVEVVVDEPDRPIDEVAEEIRLETPKNYENPKYN